MEWIFTARCPRGHFAPQQGFDAETLRQRIKADERIALYCPECGASWDAEPPQRQAMGWALNHAR